MEPANIDWKSIESRYVKDEIYEHINAPKWLDLSSPDSLPVDDEAWFCRPDCKHPKTHEDFLHFSPSPSKMKPKKSASEVMPLGERKNNNQSLKRRGAVAALLPFPSSPLRDPAKNKGNVKKFSEDLENQDPNLVATVSTNITTAANKPVKVTKEAIKSSAEKRGIGEVLQSKKPMPRLKSTLSARNLFSGRDILGQISEFCHEIKKLVAGREMNSVATDKEVGKEQERIVLLDSSAMEKNSTSARQVGEEEERKVLQDSNSRDIGGSTKKNIKLTVKAGHEGGNFKKVGDGKLSVLKEVRACPPTPQRFPSPSSRCPRNTKAATSTTSPLNIKKTVKSEASVSDQGREEKKAPVVKDDECSRTSADASDSSEGSSMDMFWFFKPCTYLGK